MQDILMFYNFSAQQALLCVFEYFHATLTAVNDLLFDSFEIRRALVVAPIRVASFRWPAEIEKWDHLKGL